MEGLYEKIESGIVSAKENGFASTREVLCYLVGYLGDNRVTNVFNLVLEQTFDSHVENELSIYNRSFNKGYEKGVKDSIKSLLELIKLGIEIEV